MAQPLLYLRDVGIMHQGVRRRRRPQRVHTEAVYVDGDADLLAQLRQELDAQRKATEFRMPLTVGQAAERGPKTQAGKKE